MFPLSHFHHHFLASYFECKVFFWYTLISVCSCSEVKDDWTIISPYCGGKIFHVSLVMMILSGSEFRPLGLKVHCSRATVEWCCDVWCCKGEVWVSFKQVTKNSNHSPPPPKTTATFFLYWIIPPLQELLFVFSANYKFYIRFWRQALVGSADSSCS